jgi:exosortase D (VPLPA-CTERM-specific)
MEAVSTARPVAWRLGPTGWGALALVAALLVVAYLDGFAELLFRWETSEEYSHGYFIPLISLFLAWRRKNELAALPLAGSRVGLAVLVLGALLLAVGTLSAIFLLVHYSLIVVLTGLVLVLLGWPGLRLLWPALLVLVFMIPLPSFLYQQLSVQLQLVSSELGVAIIRALGMSVYLEGNVIDLGVMQLQVVEACNGLRYLFPLLSFGFLAAYFFHAPLWQRLVVFFSTVPITVFMNSFRIAVTGVLVERYGTKHAEGFLHDFEGWVIFMTCVAFLVGEMWLLNRFFARERRPFREVFGIDLPGPAPAAEEIRVARLPATFVASTVLLFLVAGGALALGQRVEAVPARQEFVDFPTRLGEWTGRRDTIEANVLAELEPTDYVIADFRGPDGRTVNFYSAYYASQRAQASAHSPRSCLPGGGWQFRSLDELELPDVVANGQPLRVNRTLIQLGDYRQLVYYWFQQRGRVITNEYLVKLYILWDAVTRNRTDGALVRLVTPLERTEDVAQADERLLAFAKAAVPVLEAYVPN